MQMLQHLIRWTTFFQLLLYSNFRKITPQLVETLLLLSIGHLFSLYNPNQIADVLSVPKANLESPTFAIMVLLFFLDMGKGWTMLVFGKSLRAYVNLGVKKVVRYLMLQRVRRSMRRTFHQIQLELSGQRQMLFEISAHFHEHNIG